VLFKLAKLQRLDNMGKVNDNSKMDLSEKERKLVRLIRELAYGEIKLIIQDKVPVRVEEFKKSIKL